MRAIQEIVLSNGEKVDLVFDTFDGSLKIWPERDIDEKLITEWLSTDPSKVDVKVV